MPQFLEQDQHDSQQKGGTLGVNELLGGRTAIQTEICVVMGYSGNAIGMMESIVIQMNRARRLGPIEAQMQMRIDRHSQDCDRDHRNPNARDES